ncbi:hypothetical protein [Fodinicola acaciae]|uniref:hypothetical protein n=1 Tax=Fodinicola acaciae TaxID=2681555 RepID=UPI0013D22937|nr:hypothetical protein [Fodinicola acaciae]
MGTLVTTAAPAQLPGSVDAVGDGAQPFQWHSGRISWVDFSSARQELAGKIAQGYLGRGFRGRLRALLARQANRPGRTQTEHDQINRLLSDVDAVSASTVYLRSQQGGSVQAGPPVDPGYVMPADIVGRIAGLQRGGVDPDRFLAGVLFIDPVIGVEPTLGRRAPAAPANRSTAGSGPTVGAMRAELRAALVSALSTDVQLAGVPVGDILQSVDASRRSTAWWASGVPIEYRQYVDPVRQATRRALASDDQLRHAVERYLWAVTAHTAARPASGVDRPPSGSGDDETYRPGEAVSLERPGGAAVSVQHVSERGKPADLRHGGLYAPELDHATVTDRRPRHAGKPDRSRPFRNVRQRGLRARPRRCIRDRLAKPDRRGDRRAQPSNILPAAPTRSMISQFHAVTPETRPRCRRANERRKEHR